MKAKNTIRNIKSVSIAKVVNMPFKPIGNGKYKSPSGRIFTTKQVKLYYATNGFNKHKKAFKVDNKMRSMGEYNEGTGKIRINKKMAKKAGRGQVLDTIYHESYHVKHPKATEKQTYKATKRIVKKLSPKAKAKLYAKVK